MFFSWSSNDIQQILYHTKPCTKGSRFVKHPLHASNSARITAAGSRGRCASGCRNEGGTQTSADQLLGEVPILHGLLKLTITSDVWGFFFYSPRTIYLTLLSRGQFCPVYLCRSFYAPSLSPFVPFPFLPLAVPRHGITGCKTGFDILLIEEILVEFNEFVIIT